MKPKLLNLISSLFCFKQGFSAVLQNLKSTPLGWFGHVAERPELVKALRTETLQILKNKYSQEKPTQTGALPCSSVKVCATYSRCCGVAGNAARRAR